MLERPIDNQCGEQNRKSKRYNRKDEDAGAQTKSSSAHSIRCSDKLTLQKSRHTAIERFPDADVDIWQECGSISVLQPPVLAVPTCPHQRLGKWIPQASGKCSWINTIPYPSLHNNNVIIPMMFRSFVSTMFSGPPHHRETEERVARVDPVCRVRVFRALPLRLPTALGAGRTWMRRIPRNDRVRETATVR